MWATVVALDPHGCEGLFVNVVYIVEVVIVKIVWIIVVAIAIIIAIVKVIKKPLFYQLPSSVCPIEDFIDILYF